MKVSIITVSFNSGKTIEDTIQSVLGQTYPNIEYIVMDGMSKDNTLQIIEKYKDKIAKVVSEKDTGIYNAMNKALRLATGDVVGILNSDDLYNSSEVIAKVVKTFEEKNVDCVWGDLVYVDEENTSKVIRLWHSSHFTPGKFYWGWHPPHPTFFVRRSVYQRYGFFREDMRIAADYELMLRLLEKYKISSAYVSEVLVRMRVGGVSNQSLKNIIKANRESFRSFRENNLPVNYLTFFLKPLRKTFQFLGHLGVSKNNLNSL